jgi:uncharacterized protein
VSVTPRLPREFLDGVRLFNGGQYYEAHEAFEELLDDVEADDRWELVVALIQVAVGYHKCASGFPGGVNMLGRALEKLAPLADDAGGVAIGPLRARITADREALAAGAPAAVQFSTPPRLGLVPDGGWGD